MHRPKTRSLTAAEQLRLLDLPDACLAKILALACEGVPWKDRCCLAEVSRAFRTHFWGVAYASRPLQLNLNVLSWRIAQSKRKKAMREELQAAVARAAPSTASLVLKYQLDPICKLPLASLLAPLAPHIQELEVEDGLCVELLDALAAASLPWPALREVSLVGCTLWSDWQGGEVEALEARLAALPGVAAKVAKFEGSCQGMEQGRESFFSHLPALRSLELEDWMALDVARDYSPLRAMRHLTRLTLNIVEDLDANLASLQSLTQVQELSLVGCYRACRGLAQLPNLVLLDLQPLQSLADEEPGAMGAGGDLSVAAAWKARGLTELRWCGDVVFDEGEAPIDLPHLVALEIDEAHFPSAGLPSQLCETLTGLTSLRLVGGRCPRLPASVSRLAGLRVLSVDSCQLPAMPATVSALTAVTNLQLSNAGVGPQLPHWVLGMLLRKMWLANNALTSLPPVKPPKMRAAEYAKRLQQWLGRLTHVCLSSNQFTELPGVLLAHGEQLVELDLAYNPRLQVTSKCASAVRGMPRLRRLRLEKSYFLPASLRWTPASQRSISRLQRECPDISVECQSHAVQFHLTW